MAVTVKKKPKSNITVKVKAKQAAKTASQIIVDRIVELKKRIDSVAEDQKEFAKLTGELRAQAMEKDPDQVVSFEGTEKTIVFGEAAVTRELVDVEGAKKKLGNDTFFEIAKITLGDLDKYLTPEELAPLVKKGRGSRKIDFLDK